jgi:uncharacterized protein YjiS (DUF1127 family)
MTNRAIPQATTRAPIWNMSGIQQLWRNWRARRHIKALQDRSDAILFDIGVTRDEVSWASDLPLSKNAARELERTAYNRRKAEQLKWL